jgi:cytochrome c553
MRTFLSKIITGLTLVVACSAPSYADSDKTLTPESIHIKRCSACHYLDGKSARPEIPNIAGQYDLYLKKALKLFKDHRRESEAMELITSLHKEQELVILADYYAKQKPADTPSITSPDLSLKARGEEVYKTERVYGIACVDCHGLDAKGYVRGSPRTAAARAIPALAGQRPEYLMAEIQKYTKDVVNTGMCGMRKAGQTLSQDDIKALVEYLASK